MLAGATSWVRSAASEREQFVIGQRGVMLYTAHLGACRQQLVEIATPARGILALAARCAPIEHSLDPVANHPTPFLNSSTIVARGFSSHLSARLAHGPKIERARASTIAATHCEAVDQDFRALVSHALSPADKQARTSGLAESGIQTTVRFPAHTLSKRAP